MPALNPNAFTGNPLDRLSENRKDEAWVAGQLTAENGRMAVFHKGQPLIDTDRKEPLWLSPAARSELPSDATHILLGWWGDVPYSAIDASAAPAQPFADLGTYIPLRETGGMMGREDLAILGHAAWMLDWHRRHQFCARTGKPTQMRGGGVSRIEPETGTEHYPRVDPVAIVLPVKQDQCLLARGTHFPPNMYSALAGFLEPGETLEECAIREIREEVGIILTDVRYVFSQPWPFPSSLMVGFIAEAQDWEILLDPQEIEAARWVEKGELAALLGGERRDDLWVPPKYAIARQLMEVWVKE